jgi:hypothetical protein
VSLAHCQNEPIDNFPPDLQEITTDETISFTESAPFYIFLTDGTNSAWWKVTKADNYVFDNSKPIPYGIKPVGLEKSLPTNITFKGFGGCKLFSQQLPPTENPIKDDLFTLSNDETVTFSKTTPFYIYLFTNPRNIFGDWYKVSSSGNYVWDMQKNRPQDIELYEIQM